MSAVAYMHKHQIVHRDMKPENILVDNVDDLGTIKLIDFGLAAQIQSCQTTDLYCGTITYMAPEVAKNHNATKIVDVWAVGIMMHQVLTKYVHPIFKSGEKVENYKDILRKIKRVEPHKSLSSLVKHLFTRLCAVTPSQRLSAHQALDHPWITRTK